ncbi:hypothetical protein [Cognatilysobacter bugurensis]|uniref:J domain-containing protein n=1 Tax=Cognatilysobacter bugurensis TaxID=543356 RepID=A0A918W6T0_9GAMM|nr:hypothetical protein [Lysobacter bugurensis]GHA71981.1 hypothetical protein GCM10007067_05540 [Lysobacter bugurensis]
MSATAWDVLGIAETGDARAIKRAYAARLKITRPEADPVAFQLLSDAFEWATGHARRSAQETEHTVEPQGPAVDALAPSPLDDARRELGRPIDTPTHEASDAVGDAAPVETGAEPAQDFDFGAFFAELCEPLRRQDPTHLAAWLDHHEALYSIELKWAVMPHVFDALARRGAELNPHQGHLDVLQAFFGVDARLRRHPAIAPALDFLEARSWLDPTGVPGMRARSPEEAFEALIEKYRSKRVKPVDRMLLRELMGPVAWLRRILILLVPGLPGQLAGLFTRLVEACAHSTYARLDTEALEFWRRVTDPNSFDWRRLAVPVARAPVYAVPFVALFNWLAGQDALLAGAAATSGLAAGIGFAWTALMTAVRRLAAWNRDTLRWNPALVIVSALFGTACVLAVAGSGGWGACVAALVLLWIHTRGFGGTLFTVLGVIVSWALLFGAFQQWTDASSVTWPATVSILISAGLLVGTDVVVARVKRIPLNEARTSDAAPAWMMLAAGLVAGLCTATHAAVGAMF